MNCSEHPLNEISAICIAPHNCKRKYCSECQYEHGGDMSQYLPPELFQQQLREKSQLYKLNDEREQTKQHREYKIVLANTQIDLKFKFQDLILSIEKINETIKKQAQVYLNLINSEFPIADSSYSDLDLMVHILKGNVLDKWRFQKDLYLNQFDNLKSWLKQEIEKFIQLISTQFSDIIQEEKVLKLEGLKKQGQILVNTNFHIHYTKQREIKYIYQGEILHSFIQNDLLQKPQIITNIEQIRLLKWTGEEGKNFKKIGLWSAMWNDENCNGCGGEYTLDGNKRGMWKEMIKNYYDNAKVYEIGEYVNEFRSGIWQYVYEDQVIGGGEYKSFGQKNGNWIELSEGFNIKSQVTYNGEYKNGKKVGRWDILGWGQQIGGGSYDEEGSEIKIGNWIELNAAFSFYSKVFYTGEYQNGYKVGKWSTWWNINGENEEIGGGSYEQGGNGVKIGKWIELSDEFQYLSQVYYNGEYLKGKKVGRWDIMYKNICDQNFDQIGGGSYDERGYGIKIGNWIELIDRFGLKGQVTYIGEYKNGKKVGRWDIADSRLQIGGGSYDEGGVGDIKIGKWVDLYDGFWDQSQVFYEGEYKNDKKVGKWEIFLNKDEGRRSIGYGLYDENGIKIGRWFELSDGFSNLQQILYIGHYNNGKKIGRWDIAYQAQLIGGGNYDDQIGNMKVGDWIDLCDGFQYCQQVFYNGQYKNGSKVGKWEINVWGIQIGGGSYEERSGGMKIGEWIELSDGFSQLSQVVYKGEYKNSQKIGRWDILYKGIFDNQNFKQIGGGSYEDGIKIGNWIELIDQFGCIGQITINGEYKNGKKIGIWMELDILANQKLSEKKYSN